MFFNATLFAKECSVDDRIMFAIATVERHNKTPVGYPYLISLNLSIDQKTAAKMTETQGYFLDRRTMDCRSQNECVSILTALEKKSIINLDLGAFQTNYMFWKLKKKNYFDLEKSYDKACDIVMSHNKKGWTWENIAKYHSKTKKLNKKYSKNVLDAIKRQQ